MTLQTEQQQRRRGPRPKPRQLILCQCGCGNTRLNYDNDGRPCRFINYHSRRGTHYKMSEERKRKLSIALKGRTQPPRDGKNNGMYGRKHSVETKMKMSAALKHIWFERKKNKKPWVDKETTRGNV